MRALRTGGRFVLCALLTSGLSACRDPEGLPDYRNHVGLVPDAGPELGVEPFLPGTEPYLPGMRRLGIGLFYEGGASHRLDLSDFGACQSEPHPAPLRCYYIFTTGGALEYEQDTTADRLEGLLSDRFTLTGTPFWGGGVIWDEPTDLSSWTALALSLKSSDASFAQVTVTMQSGTDDVSAFAVEASDYGFAADGEWHALRIPLDDFVGLDLAHVRAPFVLGGTGNTAGHELLIDEVYLTQN